MAEAAEPVLPRRRLQLNLEVDADDLHHLAEALERIAMDLRIKRRESIPSLVSGGFHSGYDLTLSCNPDQTGDRYREQVDTYFKAKRARHGTK